VTNRKLTDALFFATVFSVSFEKLHWSVGGPDVNLPDILGTLFIVAWWLGRLGRRRRPLPKTEVALAGFLLVFLLVYLFGYYNLETAQAASQFLKGLVKYVLHYGFLLVGLVYVVRRSEAFYWRTLGVLMAGIAFNAAYGVLQLAVAQTGGNLDDIVLNPITGGASAINLYGVVNGTNVYRPNAMTGDPSHLGIVLLIPLLILLPMYLRMERSDPWRKRLAWLLPFLLLVELATLSRSGFLGLGVGALILLIPYRRRALSKDVWIPVAGMLGVLAVVAAVRWDYVKTVVESRVQTGDESTSTHFGIYDFIPQIIHQHPLFGLGLNNFAVYYQEITGRTNWGPHSFYVALFVETGLVGAAVFAAFIVYFFWRLGVGRRVGKALTEQGDPEAARVRPAAWGMTAALAGIMAANAFYLTMTFYYFYVFLMLIAALPIVFGKRVARNAGQVPSPATPAPAMAAPARSLPATS
jgi:O-antigen ligase